MSDSIGGGDPVPLAPWETGEGISRSKRRGKAPVVARKPTKYPGLHSEALRIVKEYLAEHGGYTARKADAALQRGEHYIKLIVFDKR